MPLVIKNNLSILVYNNIINLNWSIIYINNFIIIFSLHFKLRIVNLKIYIMLIKFLINEFIFLYFIYWLRWKFVNIYLYFLKSIKLKNIIYLYLYSIKNCKSYPSGKIRSFKPKIVLKGIKVNPTVIYIYIYINFFINYMQNIIYIIDKKDILSKK